MSDRAPQYKFFNHQVEISFTMQEALHQQHSKDIHPTAATKKKKNRRISATATKKSTTQTKPSTLNRKTKLKLRETATDSHNHITLEFVITYY